MLTSMSAPATDAVLVRADRRAARITLGLELMEELIATLHRLGEDPGVRAIVIDSAGPAFSAGHDLTEMIGCDVPFYQRLFDVCTELMETIHRVPQPVIAKVEGMATAAGCQLVAACDLVVAADGARFATPGVKIGLFAPRRWCRSRAQSAASVRWRCCSPGNRSPQTPRSTGAW